MDELEALSTCSDEPTSPRPNNTEANNQQPSTEATSQEPSTAAYSQQSNSEFQGSHRPNSIELNNSLNMNTLNEECLEEKDGLSTSSPAALLKQQNLVSPHDQSVIFCIIHSISKT